jgi:glutaconate CoA-transferase subunit B
VRYAEKVSETPAPSAQELSVLREVQARTARAHGQAVSEAA